MVESGYGLFFEYGSGSGFFLQGRIRVRFRLKGRIRVNPIRIRNPGCVVVPNNQILKQEQVAHKTAYYEGNRESSISGSFFIKLALDIEVFEVVSNNQILQQGRAVHKTERMSKNPKKKIYVS